MPRITLRDLESDRPISCPYTDALIGRDPSAALLIEGPNAKVVSGQHARIFFQDDSWWIQDLSRNGTVVDNERLIKGERHALRIGQVVGLGDSGPRLRVEVLESRLVAETITEQPELDRSSGVVAAAGPRHGPGGAVSSNDKATDAATAALRKSEPRRAGLRIEEPTEPMKPAPDWELHVAVRMTHTNLRHEVRGEVITTGRSPECVVQIPPELGASVSRVHAEIAIRDGGVTLRDAGSRNGTFLNGHRITEPVPIRKGDLVMLGPGGPTFTIEELRIVKGEGLSPFDGERRGPSDPLPREPDTEPPEGGSVIGRMLRGIGRVFGS